MKQATLNLNGSSPERLIEDHRTILELVGDVLDKIGSIAPHGRDYQTHESGKAFDADRATYASQVSALNRIKNEITDSVIHLMNERDRTNG